MLDRLGMALTNRNIYRWDAGVPTDTNGIPILPNDFSLSEAASFLRTNLLMEVQGASANLAKVNDPYFLRTLSSNETKIAPVTVDYADARMLSALLHAFEFTVHYVSSLDLDAQLNAIYAIYGRETVSAGELTAFQASNSIWGTSSPETNPPAKPYPFFRADDLSGLVRFEGRVIDGETGAGILGATVATSIDGATTSTDQTGRFVLRTQTRREKIGSYVITVSSSSYRKATLGQYLRQGNEAVGLEIKAYRPPVITQQPSDLTVRIGSSATFSIVASATPPPTYTWQRGTMALTGNSSTLNMTSAKLNDAGEYSVTVSSAGGSVKSRIAKLVVIP